MLIVLNLASKSSKPALERQKYLRKPKELSSTAHDTRPYRYFSHIHNVQYPFLSRNLRFDTLRSHTGQYLKLHISLLIIILH
jgi:hypothetical protein